MVDTTKFESIKIKNTKGLNLDVNIYYSSIVSSKFIILSTAFVRNMDYMLAYREFAKRAANEGYNAILFSFTGLGKSEGVFSEIDLNDQRDDLTSIINFVRIKKQDAQFCLLGHSLGATTSILAFVSAIEDGFEDIKAIMVWNSTLRAKEVYARYKEHYADPNNMTKDHELYLTGEHINSGRAMWESCGKIDSINELKKVTIPIFAIFGEQDSPERLIETRQMLDSLPNSLYILLPEVDHEFTIPGSQEKVIEESLNWLKEHF
ncbi:MAG: alpha/beta hydrolase [Candidatus Woesearchaeota archaeon]|jgi:hypothetical protein